MPEWTQGIPGPIWTVAGMAIVALLYYVGDRHWAPKPKDGRAYAIEPTKEEEREAKKAEEDQMRRFCNEEYVRRERYHKDMDTMTAEIQRVRIDVQDLTVTIAKMGVNLATLADTSKEQGAFLREIMTHTRELNERDARWKPQLGVPASVDISPR